MFMSISFRTDLGSNGVPAANGTHAPDLRLDSRPAGGQLYTPPVHAVPAFAAPAYTPPLYAPPVYAAPDARPPDTRSPDMRNADVRSLDARLTEIKNSAATRDLPDVKMDQIRELLFGEVQRQSEQRITTLEAKVRDLETAMSHRLDAMQARIEALAAETRGDRRSTLDELARGITDLGDRVKRIPRD
jgi:hypothetical protein